MAMVSRGPAERSATLAARFGMNQTWRVPGCAAAHSTKRSGAKRSPTATSMALTTKNAAMAPAKVLARSFERAQNLDHRRHAPAGDDRKDEGEVAPHRGEHAEGTHAQREDQRGREERRQRGDRPLAVRLVPALCAERRQHRQD